MGTFVYCGLPVLLAKAKAARDRAVAAQAEETAEVASAGAAVDTGTLSGGIRAEIDGATAKVSATAETHPGQAHYQEVGSIHNPATRYMENAALEAARTFPQKLADEARSEF